MLRELNETEMEMVSGGQESPADEVVSDGTYTPDTPTPAGSLPSGGGNGASSYSVIASDGSVFTGALANEHAAIYEAHLRGLRQSVNPTPTINNPLHNIPLDAQTDLSVDINGNIIEGTISELTVTVTRVNR